MFNKKLINMFTVETGKKVLVTVASVLVAMAIHQKFIAPMIAKKATVAAK